MKEKFLNWLGMKIYNNSDTFKNIVYGIYYKDVQLPNINKIKELEDEVLNLKTKLNVVNDVQTVKNETTAEPKRKKRIYTKHKKVTE